MLRHTKPNQTKPDSEGQIYHSFIYLLVILSILLRKTVTVSESLVYTTKKTPPKKDQILEISERSRFTPLPPPHPPLN